MRVGATHSRNILGAAWACALGFALISARPVWAQTVPDQCFDDAAQRYGVDAALLKAVARAESNLRPDAINSTHVQQTRTRDIGLMQINTSWLPQLARHGITEQHLFQPCTNVAVGAWILAGELARHGDTWEAVGAYNASCSVLKGAACTQARQRYAWRVYRRLDRSIERQGLALHQAASTPQGRGADAGADARVDARVDARAIARHSPGVIAISSLQQAVQTASATVRSSADAELAEAAQ